ncbi:MAG: bifunctional riboflavin kinase/FAD synthetase [Bacteroidia bacterium]
MQVFHGPEAYEAGAHPVVTIGTFDGVHLGHQSILNRIVKEAQKSEGESVLVTFEPHPRLVLFPENNPLRLLQTLDEKIATLDRLGIDKMLVMPFTKAFSRTPSKRFIHDILVKTTQARQIIIGYDHRFGKNRTGGLEELRQYKDEFRYQVAEIPAQAIDSANVSSTKIRKSLNAGDINMANRYLGYPYSLGGRVVEGAKLGRTLGYPTANLDTGFPHKLVPAHGVYLVRVWEESPSSGGNSSQRKGDFHYGLMSIGTNPTVGENLPRTTEVFIYDFEGDLYGKWLRVDFLEFLRPQIDFKGDMDALRRAMNGDSERGRDLFQKFPHPSNA